MQHYGTRIMTRTFADRDTRRHARDLDGARRRLGSEDEPPARAGAGAPPAKGALRRE
jgi:hypothetical protein